MTRPSPQTARRLIGLSLIVLWEAIPRLGILPELFIPPLTKTLYMLWLDRAIYIAALLVTLYEVAIAMLIACGVGILLGAVVGGVASIRKLMLPIFSSLYAVPIVILYPVFTAWLGIGSQAKIVFGGVYGLFPVLLSTAAGVRVIEEQYLIAARSMGASLPQLITRVIVPAAIPTVLAGLRLGGALTIIGVVFAEMLTSANGIGYLVTKNRTTLDSPRVFAAITVILALAIVYDAAMRLIERRTRVWQTAGRREAAAADISQLPAPATG